MGNFQKGGARGNSNRGGGGGGFRGGSRGNQPSYGGRRGGDREEITMHKAICDKCKKNCEVPFMPSNNKPVYCSDCFGGKRFNEERRPRMDFEKRPPRREFSDITTTFPKPAPVQDNTKKQLEEINIKLDRLIYAIEKINQSKENIISTAELVPSVKSKKGTKDILVLQSDTKKAMKKVLGKKKK